MDNILEKIKGDTHVNISTFYDNTTIKCVGIENFVDTIDEYSLDGVMVSKIADEVAVGILENDETLVHFARTAVSDLFYDFKGASIPKVKFHSNTNIQFVVNFATVPLLQSQYIFSGCKNLKYVRGINGASITTDHGWFYNSDYIYNTQTNIIDLDVDIIMNNEASEYSTIAARVGRRLPYMPNLLRMRVKNMNYSIDIPLRYPKLKTEYIIFMMQNIHDYSTYEAETYPTITIPSSANVDVDAERLAEYNEIMEEENESIDWYNYLMVVKGWNVIIN